MIVWLMAAVKGKNFATMLIGPCFMERNNASGISLGRIFFLIENLVDLVDLKDFEFKSCNIVS